MSLESAMKRTFESAEAGKGAQIVREAFKKGDFRLGDFSIRRLAETTMGRQWVEDLVPRGGVQTMEQVNSSMFLTLANVVLSGVILDEFAQADINRGDQLAETRTVPFIDQGRDIGLTYTDAKSMVVDEGQPFPAFGMGSEYRTYPSTLKRGAMVELTKEAVHEDRTGRLIENCQGVAEEIVADKNERILRVVLGIDNSVWQPNGVPSATYTAAAPRANLLSGTDLLDWTDIDAAYQLWSEMAHPVTGRPIRIPVDKVKLLVMPAKLATANYILNATHLDVGDVTSGSPTGVSRGANPISFLGKNILSPEASQMAYYMLTKAAALGGGGVSAANAKATWFLGVFEKAFMYLQNYGLTVLTQGADSEASFRRDVIFALRASERGVPAVKDPRYILKMYQA
jgi:hypothetical protein